MSRPDRNSPERIDQTATAIVRGERFSAFMADPDVVRFFADYEAERIDEIVNANPTDDDARRAAALSLNAMREFVAFVTSAIAAGKRGETTLRKDKTNV